MWGTWNTQCEEGREERTAARGHWGAGKPVSPNTQKVTREKWFLIGIARNRPRLKTIIPELIKKGIYMNKEKNTKPRCESWSTLARCVLGQETKAKLTPH